VKEAEAFTVAWQDQYMYRQTLPQKMSKITAAGEEKVAADAARQRKRPTKGNCTISPFAFCQDLAVGDGSRCFNLKFMVLLSPERA